MFCFFTFQSNPFSHKYLIRINGTIIKKTKEIRYRVHQFNKLLSSCSQQDDNNCQTVPNMTVVQSKMTIIGVIKLDKVTRMS